MNEQDFFILADEALKNVVDQIRNDQWDLVVPDDLTRRPGTTLRRCVPWARDARLTAGS